MSKTPRFATALFCEDVRTEQGHKMSYIGVCLNGIDIELSPNEVLPYHLPKLCAVLTAQTPKEDPFNSLAFEIDRDGVVLHRVDVPAEALENLKSMGQAETKGEYLSCGGFVVMPNIPIQESQTLRAWAVTEREKFEAGVFNIRMHRPSASK